MPINNESVVSTKIAIFDNGLYSKLCNMEDHCYKNSNQSNGKASTYSPHFKDLSDSLVDWMSIDREDSVRDLIMSCYSYEMLYSMYGIRHDIDYTKLNVFNIDGVVDDIKNADLDYFDSYNHGNNSVVTISDKTSLIIGAHNNQEVDEVKLITTKMRTIIGNNNFNLLFSNTVPNASYTKEEISNIIFKDNQYSDVLAGLNVGDLVDPTL